LTAQIYPYSARPVPCGKDSAGHEAQIDEAVVLYQDGWTLHNVGQHLGVADQTARRVLVERGVTIRPGGRSKAAAVA
jgi:hypothetical protein